MYYANRGKVLKLASFLRRFRMGLEKHYFNKE